MPEMDWTPLWLTMQLAAVTVVVLLIIGTPLAWWLAFTKSRFRTMVEAVVARDDDGDPRHGRGHGP